MANLFGSLALLAGLTYACAQGTRLSHPLLSCSLVGIAGLIGMAVAAGRYYDMVQEHQQIMLIVKRQFRSLMITWGLASAVSCLVGLALTIHWHSTPHNVGTVLRAATGPENVHPKRQTLV